MRTGQCSAVKIAHLIKDDTWRFFMPIQLLWAWTQQYSQHNRISIFLQDVRRSDLNSLSPAVIWSDIWRWRLRPATNQPSGRFAICRARWKLASVPAGGCWEFIFEDDQLADWVDKKLNEDISSSLFAVENGHRTFIRCYSRRLLMAVDLDVTHGASIYTTGESVCGRLYGLHDQSEC